MLFILFYRTLSALLMKIMKACHSFQYPTEFSVYLESVAYLRGQYTESRFTSRLPELGRLLLCKEQYRFFLFFRQSSEYIVENYVWLTRRLSENALFPQLFVIYEK